MNDSRQASRLLVLLSLQEAKCRRPRRHFVIVYKLCTFTNRRGNIYVYVLVTGKRTLRLMNIANTHIYKVRVRAARLVTFFALHACIIRSCSVVCLHFCSYELACSYCNGTSVAFVYEYDIKPFFTNHH